MEVRPVRLWCWLFGHDWLEFAGYHEEKPRDGTICVRCSAIYKREEYEIGRVKDEWQNSQPEFDDLHKEEILMTDNKHYTYTNSKGVVYHLNRKDSTTSSGATRSLYFFSKDVRDTATSLPAGRAAKENPKTGFPVLGKADQ